MLWRLHVRPSAEEDIDPVEVCLEQDVVGVGWPVGDTPESKEDYFAAGRERYGTSSWQTALSSLIEEVNQDDLVWFRDFEGIYYLARIDGGWEYRDDPENVRADVINVRPAEIYQVERTVPGKLKNCFIPGRTLQRVKNDTVDSFSRLVFNQLSGRERYSVPAVDTSELFDLLDDEELEDVTALYLQLEEGYAMVPSSRESKGTTIAYEYELVSRGSADRVYVQVKGGNRRLDPWNYEESEGEWYLFSPAGYKSGDSPSHVTPIERDDMEEFALNNMDQMPVSIRAWIEYAES